MAQSKYYWLKLMKDFFMKPKIKKLRRIAGGDTYTIIYLKMQLLSLNDDAVLIFQGIEEDFVEELALTIDEDPDNVKVTVNYLLAQGLLKQISDTEYLLTETQLLIGSETSGAQRTRKCREKQKALQCNTQVTISNEQETNCNIEKEKELDKEKDKEKDKELEEETSKEEETDAAPSPSSLFESFESEFARPLSPIEVQLIADWQKAYSDDIIMLALAEGVKNNARSFRYIEVILNAWKQAGVRNVEEAKMQIGKKQSDKSPKSKISEMPSWYENQDLVQPKGIQVDDDELKRLQEALK